MILLLRHAREGAEDGMFRNTQTLVGLMCWLGEEHPVAVTAPITNSASVPRPMRSEVPRARGPRPA
jgi:hypothetical protein